MKGVSKAVPKTAQPLSKTACLEKFYTNEIRKSQNN